MDGTDAAWLQDVRTAPHDGFERVVFEFDAGDAFTYEVRYVDEAIPPSGEPLTVAGDAVREMTASRASRTTSRGRSALDDTPDVAVATLDDPLRLVVDIATG